MRAPRVLINDNDDSLFSGTLPTLEVSGAQGITERGPANDPSRVITSQAEYRRLFGGLVAGSNFPQLALRYLGKGGKLRINRVVAYTDITDKSTMLALKPGVKTIATAATGGSDLYTVSPKYPGAKYNDLKHEVTAATNGQAGYFNIRLYIAGDVSNTLETYENLTIVGRPTIDSSDYLDLANQLSELVTFGYKDLSAIAAGATLRPLNAVTAFTGGSNGSAPSQADYAGDAVAGTGLHGFDPYDDMFQIATPDVYDASINQAGIAYADGRKDLMFFAHINQALTSPAAINAQRDAVTIDSKYGAFFSGGLIIKDPKTQETVNVSETMDVMFLAAKNADQNGPWLSFANYTRGQINDALGAVTNFGSFGSYAQLDAVAAHQVNMVVNQDGRTFLKSGFTSQLSESKASFINVVMTLIYIKKALRPMLNRFLEEPTDLTTFRAIYREVEPLMRRIKDSRGLYNWRWEGDQNVDVITNVKINTLTDLDKGIYKAKLGLEPIVGMQEIIIDISLNRTGELTIDLGTSTN